MDSRLYRKGISLMLGKGVIAIVIAMLVGTLAASAQSTDERLRKAADNIQRGHLDYAVEEYGGILKDHPRCIAALFYRAYCNDQLRRYALARADYEAMLLITPRHSEARLCLSHTLLKMKRNTEALDQVNTIVEQYPDSAFSYVARASIEQELGMEQPAIYDMEQAVRLAPANRDYILDLAGMYEKAAEFEKAKKMKQKYRETFAHSK